MNKRWVHICIIVILALLYFRGVYLRPGEVVYSPNSDLVRYHAPQHSFTVESLKRDGEIPLWLPWRWSGTPSLGDMQSQIFYPVTWLLLPVSPDFSHGYFFIIHAVLAGIFMYFYLAEIRLSGPACLLGAAFYMLGGAAFYMYFYQHVIYPFSWCALLLLLSERLVRRRSLLCALLLGLIAAVHFLGCHPQFFTFDMCLVLCYLAWRIFQGGARGARARICLYLAASSLLFLLLIAVQLLPALEFSRHLSRRGGLSLYEASYPLFYPWNFWKCVFTAPGEEYYGVFFGFGISTLALWGMVSSARRVKAFFVFFVLVCLVYALGKFSPLFYLCYTLLPPFRFFREPERSLLTMSFAWIALAALAVDSLMDGAGASHSPAVSFRRSLRLAAGAALAAVPVFFLCTPPGREFAMRSAAGLYRLGRFNSTFEAHRAEVEEIISGGAWMGLQLLLFVAVSYLLLCLIVRRSGAFKRRVVIPAVALAVLGELLYIGTGLETIRPEVLYRENEPLRLIKEQEGRFRVLGLGTPRPLPQVLARHHGIELADGYGPSMLADYLLFTNRAADVEGEKVETKLPLTDVDLEDIRNGAVLDLLNVRFILSLKPSENERYDLIGSFRNVPFYRQFDGIVPEPEYYVYENPSALPRAFVVPRSRVVADRGEQLRLLGDLDPRQVVLLEKEAGIAEGGEPFRAVPYTSFEPNEIVLRVSVARPAYLVLSEIWYPGWKARDNGREREVLRVDYLLRGIHLDPGDHEVVFRFEPKSYAVGRGVTAAGAIACFLAIAIVWRAGRRRGR